MYVFDLCVKSTLPGQSVRLDLSKLRSFGKRVNIFKSTVFESCVSLGISVKTSLLKFTQTNQR